MDPNSESTFPNEFCAEMRATDKVIQQNPNTEKKNQKSKIRYTVIKWRPENQIPTKNGKTTFPKEFFQ